MDNSGYDPITTSYDYDAPISENGAYTNKYYIVKELVASANPVKTLVPDPPEYVAPLAYPKTMIEKMLSFNSLIEENSPVVIESHGLLPMELLDINDGSGQSDGYIVYRKENVDLAENSVLIIEGG